MGAQLSQSEQRLLGEDTQIGEEDEERVADGMQEERRLVFTAVEDLRLSKGGNLRFINDIWVTRDL